MKQHSYAFYNGHLSTVYKQREVLRATLGKLQGYAVDNKSWTGGHSTSFSTSSGPQGGSPVARIASARRGFVSDTSLTEDVPIEDIISDVNSSTPLGPAKAAMYKIALQDEFDQLTKEIVRNTTAPERAYPNNLTLFNMFEYLLFPIIVYELEYPRSETIRWNYVFEKLAALVGVLFVMNMLSQTFICKREPPINLSAHRYIYLTLDSLSLVPVVVKAIAMKEAGMPLGQRLQEFPWMLSDLIFPFMMEYLVSFSARPADEKTLY